MSRRDAPSCWLLLLAVAGLGLALPACGGEERSTEAFCKTLQSEKQRILAQFKLNSDPATGDNLLDAFTGLGASVQALGELRTYFNKLADVAPEEIREETEIIAEQYGKQLDSVGEAAANPLAGVAGSLFSSLAVSGQMNTVHTFALENCDEGL